MTTPVLVPVPVPVEPDVKDVTVDTGVTFVVSKTCRENQDAVVFSKLEQRLEYEPVVASVQAFISKTTPFGDSPLVVRTMVISTRDIGVFDGICDESSSAGFFLSSFGLELLKIGLSLILFPSGE